MTSMTVTLQVNEMGRSAAKELTRRARRLGLTPQQYVKRVVEEDLAVDREARSKTFAQIMGPGKDVNEEEVDRLVEKAKTRHHLKMPRRKS